MLSVVSVALFFSYAMVIWFKSNAFVEYLTLFNMDELFHVAEYNELHKQGYGDNYAGFLYEYYKDNFFVRLVSCPICLSFWLGLIECFFLGPSALFTSSPLILFFYAIFNKML